MSSWASRGIKRLDGRSLGVGDAGLLLPAGPQGPAFLVTKNFDVIYSYNAAESYTLAIAILASASPAAGRRHALAEPTTPACRAPNGANCKRCSPNTATTSAPRRRHRRQDKKRHRRFPGQERPGGGWKASVKVLEALRR